MTPKEKAEELYRTYIDYTHGHFNCKQCVRIAVDEIITFGNQQGVREPMMYWNKVKEELEKL
jgi:hypothetical protein